MMSGGRPRRPFACSGPAFARAAPTFRAPSRRSHCTPAEHASTDDVDAQQFDAAFVRPLIRPRKRIQVRFQGERGAIGAQLIGCSFCPLRFRPHLHVGSQRWPL